MNTLAGRCLCGAVRIAITPPSDFVSHCHCESCRRAHAAAVVTWLGVPEGQLTLSAGQELLTRYESSPGGFRCFCSRCGTSMLTYYTSAHAEYASAADRRYVPLAVLEGAADRQPDSHVSFEERAAWFSFDDALPRFVAKSDEPA